MEGSPKSKNVTTTTAAKAKNLFTCNTSCRRTPSSPVKAIFPKHPDSYRSFLAAAAKCFTSINELFFVNRRFERHFHRPCGQLMAGQKPAQQSIEIAILIYLSSR
jgi:hypothetical protein